MINPENPAFENLRHGFETSNLYRNLDKAPKTVVTQTREFIVLTGAGIISPATSRNYYQSFTEPFLKDAFDGSSHVFDRKLFKLDPQSAEINEAADFSNVVFTWMHYFAKSKYLPNGFSRKGVLMAPENQNDFVGRLREIKFTLPIILRGEMNGKNLWSNAKALRTFMFFDIGSSIPLKFSDDNKEKEEYEREVFENLTKDINFNL